MTEHEGRALGFPAPAPDTSSGPAEPVRADPVRPDPVRADPGPAEPVRADPATLAQPHPERTQAMPGYQQASAAGPAGVPPRSQPLPPPRPVRLPAGGPGTPGAPRPGATRPSASVRPAARTRKARLVLKRIDPWSVFLYSVVASIFIGVATLVAVGLLYAVLSKLGVLSSVNKLIGDVTAEPGTTSQPAHLFSAGKVMTFATLIAALDVVLITALSTLGALLYNVCAALTGGIEVTLSDQN